MPISLVILVIGIQDLYTSKYKYTISEVIYEIITRKFRVMVEPFWDLKISEYVEYLYLTPVSIECPTSCE